MMHLDWFDGLMVVFWLVMVGGLGQFVAPSTIVSRCWQWLRRPLVSGVLPVESAEDCRTRWRHYLEKTRYRPLGASNEELIEIAEDSLARE